MEGDKVRGSFFQAGGWRAEADEKESFYFPLGTPSKRGLLEKYFVTVDFSFNLKCVQA